VIHTLAQANPDGDTFVAQNIFFGIIAAVMLVSAWRVVTTKNVVHAALYLVIVLAGVAAQFILLGAEFIGITQVLVYIGAIIVLFLFGIMLTRARLGDDEGVRSERRLMASLVGLVLFGVMAAALIGDFEDTHLDIAEPSTTAQVSDSIFSQYLIPFEVVGMLLLAALIGAIVVARKD
jgi:NADH-quinone oxidoreductase subunit J